MQKRISIKNHQHEIQLVTQRTIVGLIVIGLLTSLLIIRLAYLQLYKNNLYTTLSTKNWLDLVPVEPTRGLIYDRNGVLLAENIPVFSLDLIPNQVPDLKKSLMDLSKIISINDNDINQFKKQLFQHRRFDEIPLKLRLTEEEVAKFTENQYRFPGVLIKARLMRHYPYGESFSHVLGYVGRINAQELNEIDPINYSASHYIGKLGIEKYYEEELHGSVGYEEVENDASGRVIRTLKKIKGKTGKNLYLTLDSGLQFAAEKALGDHYGAVVAIQPKTGQILALVSKPGYDPNQFVLGISQQDYQNLQKSDARPLFNRALQGLYPLASTIKPILALEGLDSGVITPGDTIYDPGWYRLHNSTHRFRDWQRHGHGIVNLHKAIADSCDTYFYDLGMKLGIRRIDNILTQFGFGAMTGIDLDEELPGLVASPEWKMHAKGVRWYDGDTVISSIGQGFMLATPLQLANAATIIANRGERLIPFLLLGEQEPGSKTFTPQKSVPIGSVVLHDPQTWDTVIQAMKDVVMSPQGSAYRKYGKNYSYTVAAKTGTAQVTSKYHNEIDDQSYLPEKLRNHNLFIAFAPIDQPRIALVIVTEHSHVAVSVARTILDYYLGNQANAVRPNQTKIQKANA